MRWARLVLVALLVPTTGAAQPWSGIIQAPRAIDWTGAGATIVNRTTVCTTLSPGTTAALINAAIQACPAGQVVQLTAGTYNLTGQLMLSKSNVTLRGAGSSSTILNFSAQAGNCGLGGSESSVVRICGGFNGGIGDGIQNSANWTAGFAQGTTVITLSAVTNLAIGSTIWLDQLSDTADTPSAPGAILCTAAGVNCSNQGGQFFMRTGRGTLEGHTVTNIAGLNVTITPPVLLPTFRIGQTPQAAWNNLANVGVGIGLEDLTINPTGALGNGFYMINATNSWVKGVRVIRSDTTGSETRLSSVVNGHAISVVDSYFYGPAPTGSVNIYGFTPGPMSYSVFQNNIQHSPGTIVGASGLYTSVFAYNINVNPVVSLGTVGLLEHNISGMNLIEGNNWSNYSTDIIHASHSFNTLFRNYFDGNLRNIQNSEIRAAAMLYSKSRIFNIIGNVFSAPNWTTYESNQAQNTAAVYVTGWQGTGSGTTVPNDPAVATSLMRWGNYDSATGTVRFVSGEVPTGFANFPNSVPASQTLPASLYLPALPASWWGTPFGNPPWPANGPDVTGGPIAATAGHAYKIPARLCFENTPVDPAFPSSNPRILLFNAAACYTGVQVVPPGTGPGSLRTR